MPLSFDDDANIHSKTDAVDWRESYYLNFAATNNELNGMAWQGVRPNAGHGEAMFILYDGAQPLIHASDLKVPVAEDIGEGRMVLGNQRFECVEPWRHWRIHFDDGASWVTIDWYQLSEACDWEWEDLTSSKHYNLSGRVELTGEVKGKRISATGYGERDRAWGSRDYDVFECAYSLMSQYPDNSGCHAFLYLTPAGEWRLHGYLHKDGVTRDLARFEARNFTYTGENGPIENGIMHIVDDLGRELEIVDTPRRHYLSFGTDGTGAQLTERDPGANAKGRAYFTFRKFVRSDGVVGAGLIDFNFHAGNTPSDFTVEGPIHSVLYDYGLSDLTT